MRYLKLFTSLFVYISIPVFLYLYHKYHLIILGEYQFFTTSWNAFIQALSYPGGILEYLNDFLLAFFRYPASGPIIIGTLLLLCGGLFTLLLKKINRHSVFFILPLIVTIWLGVLHLNMLIRLTPSLMFLFTILFALIYVSIKNDYYRWSIGFALILISYWTGIVSSIILFSIYCVWESFCSDNKKRFIYLVLSALSVIAIPLITRYLLADTHPLTIKDAFLGNIFTMEKEMIVSRFYKIWMSPAVCMLFLFLIAKKEEIWKQKKSFLYIISTIQILLIGILLWIGSKKIDNYQDDEIFMELDYLVKQERWEDIVQRSQQGMTFSQLNYPYINLALIKTGKLTPNLMRYSNNNQDMMLVPFMYDYLTSKILSEIFYYVGDISNAQHVAFEGMVSTPGGGNVYLMKRLTECALILKDYKVAGKYLRLLQKTPAYKNWASDLLTLLDNESRLSSLPWISEKRKLLVKENKMLYFDNIFHVCTPLLDANPGNRVAFEYATASTLLEKDIRSFIKIYQQYNPNIKPANVPVIHQEAFTIYMEASKIPFEQWGKAAPVTDETIKRLVRFKQLLAAKKNVNDPAIQKEFGKTYWYYYMINQ